MTQDTAAETSDASPVGDGEITPPSPPPAVHAAPVPRRHDWIACIALTILATLCYADVLLGINNFYMRDLTRYYYPTKQIVREIMLGGELPYWNRYFHAGQPMAANPEHEVFYPLTWLILLPSYDFGYRLHILIHLYIGLLGMYALLRSMELRPPAAFFGALSFGLGGLYLSYVNLLPILFCAAWIPLTCLYTRRFLLFKRARDFVLASLFLGIQCLVGEPTTILQTGFLLGMYALYRGWYDRPRVRNLVMNVVWIGLISIAAFAIGAAQLIPAADHVGESARSRVFGFDLVSAWSMPWAKYAELIYPNLLGHLSVERVTWYWGGGLYPGMGSPFLFSIYSGLLVTALVVGGAFTRPRGGRFVLIICIFSSLIALGGHTPVLKWLYDAGIATGIRYPEKFILLAVFALIVFAAQMLDKVLAGDEKIREGAVGFTLAVFIVAAIVAISTFTPLFAKYFSTTWGLKPGGGTTRMIELASRDWIYAALRGGALLALLVTLRRVRRDAWLAAAAVFVCIDLWPIAQEINPRMPAHFFRQRPPLAAELPANRKDFRVFHEVDWYGTEDPARRYFGTGAAVYWVVRNGLFPMTPAGAGVRTVLERDYDKTALLPTIDLTDSVWDVKRSGKVDWYQPFMAMSNAWYRAAYRPYENEQKRTRGDFTKSHPVDFRPAGKQYPRYYFADQVVTVKDRHDFVKKLIANSYSDRVAFTREPGFVPGDGVVHRVDEKANSAILDVESFGRGFLVMSVTPHKYWTIRIDGREVKPVVTNIAYQGIVMPPGRHRVEMMYVNGLVRIGVTISIATAVLMLAIVVFTRRRMV